MKIETNKEISVTLQLTEFEARWLKSVVQNPIGVDYEDELEQDSEMRKNFWYALDNAGVK